MKLCLNSLCGSVRACRELWEAIYLIKIYELINMKKYNLLFMIFLCSLNIVCAQSFKQEQQKNTRVKNAYKEKWDELKVLLKEKGINENAFEIFIRAFKKDEVLEVWAKSKTDKQYKLLKSYSICASSGVLGPKRKQGDGQVPEGFYHVSVFNPYSNFHLSLGVSYPNQSDKIIGKSNLGGDIMIHGNCVTIGCLPLTDKFIKEVYILAVEAKNAGQSTIPIHIFPTKLDGKSYETLTEDYKGKTELLDFWKNLKTGYDYFEKNKTLPNVTVDKVGKYIFK